MSTKEKIRPIFNWLYKNAKPVYDVLQPIRIYYINVSGKSHYYPTGNKRGTFRDHRDRMYEAMTWEFLDFIEDEFIINKFYWIDDVDISNLSVYDRVMLALDYDEEIEGYQSEVSKKAKIIYKYLKVDRPNLVRIESGYLDLWYGNTVYDSGTHKLKKNSKASHYWKRLEKYENMLHECDQKILQMIVDIRPWLWT